ncbi:MAG: DUF2513 domain-containing protein [Candidatus Thiodiazotropha endolucinida]|nr:DUF2513 domain-containing protein [Candidatus Thiodiazotropha endolucinida]
MKRDLELIRKLLVHLEEKPTDEMIKELEIGGYDKDQVMYHFILMDEAGFIRCERIVSSSTPDRVIKVHPFSLTWQGHEFLEAARNKKIWKSALNKVKGASGSVSVEVLKELLVAMLKEGVGL